MLFTVYSGNPGEIPNADRATRLHGMGDRTGYVGSVDHFRHLLALHRPNPKQNLSEITDLPRRASKSTGAFRPTLETACA